VQWSSYMIQGVTPFGPHRVIVKLPFSTPAAGSCIGSEAKKLIFMNLEMFLLTGTYPLDVDDLASDAK